MEKSYKTCLHFTKFLQKIPATWKIVEKSFIVLGFNLMFSGSKNRFFPLNLDWNPKSFSEGKCQQRNTQTNFFLKKMKVYLQMYLNIVQNTSIFRKSLRETCKEISIWRFLMTAAQLPHTFIDQVHMQLSRSYIFGNADSSSDGTP